MREKHLLNLQRRVIKLQEEMVKKKLDLIVYGNCQNFQYLTARAIDELTIGNSCQRELFPKMLKYKKVYHWSRAY